MGTWSADSFGNDEALDWLADLLGEDDPYFVQDTLDIIVDYPGSEQPESWDCSCALAAAELVATALGNPPPNFPNEAQTWLEKTQLSVDEELLASARKAVERIQHNSELKQLWEESEHKSQWYSALEDLKRRLDKRSP